MISYFYRVRVLRPQLYIQPPLKYADGLDQPRYTRYLTICAVQGEITLALASIDSLGLSEYEEYSTQLSSAPHQPPVRKLFTN